MIVRSKFAAHTHFSIFLDGLLCSLDNSFVFIFSPTLQTTTQRLPLCVMPCMLQSCNPSERMA
jgi:hypothetical protein